MAAVPEDGTPLKACCGASGIGSGINSGSCFCDKGAMKGFLGMLNSMLSPKFIVGNSILQQNNSIIAPIISKHYIPFVALLFSLYFSTRLQKALTDSFQLFLLSIERVKKSEGWLLAFPFPLEEVGFAVDNS